MYMPACASYQKITLQIYSSSLLTVVWYSLIHLLITASSLKTVQA